MNSRLKLMNTGTKPEKTVEATILKLRRPNRCEYVDPDSKVRCKFYAFAHHKEGWFCKAHLPE